MDDVVMVVVKKKEKYLLVSLNKHLEKFNGFWCTVGDHVEKGETKKETLKRELKEELGISAFDVQFIESSPGDIQNKLLHWYFCKTKYSKLKIDKREIKKARFFTKEEISKIKLWPSVEKIFNKYVFHKN